jgi:hypothetical protein
MRSFVNTQTIKIGKALKYLFIFCLILLFATTTFFLGDSISVNNTCGE